MRTIKTFIIVLIGVCTALAIGYLVLQAKRLERYTAMVDYMEKYYIVFSSGGGTLKDSKNISDIRKFALDYIKQSGAGGVEIKAVESNLIRKEIINSMKRERQYILADVNITKLLTSENSILIRVGKKDNDKYNDNMEYASKVKELIASVSKDIKVSIISDSKNNYNQDLGYRSIRIEISNKNTYENGKRLLALVFDALGKIE